MNEEGGLDLDAFRGLIDWHIAEETDAIAIVVSEETGRISVAAFGELNSDLTLAQVEQQVLRHLAGKKDPSRTADMSGTQQIVIPRLEDNRAAKPETNA